MNLCLQHLRKRAVFTQGPWLFVLCAVYLVPVTMFPHALFSVSDPWTLTMVFHFPQLMLTLRSSACYLICNSVSLSLCWALYHKDDWLSIRGICRHFLGLYNKMFIKTRWSVRKSANSKLGWIRRNEDFQRVEVQWAMCLPANTGKWGSIL